MTKKDRKKLKESTVKWTTNYPKGSDLVWRIKKPGEKDYLETKKMPFDLSKDYEYNRKNVESYQRGTLSEFL